MMRSVVSIALVVSAVAAMEPLKGGNYVLHSNQNDTSSSDGQQTDPKNGEVGVQVVPGDDHEKEAMVIEDLETSPSYHHYGGYGYGGHGYGHHSYGHSYGYGHGYGHHHYGGYHHHGYGGYGGYHGGYGHHGGYGYGGYY